MMDATMRKTGGTASGVSVARTIEDVEALRPEWEALQGHALTSDLDYFLTYLRHAPGVVRPHVVRIEQDGELALLVGRVEDQRLPAKLGYATVSNPRVRMIIVAYGGVLGRADAATAPRLVEALRRSVAPREADLVRIRMLEVGSALHTVATEQAPRLRLDRLADPLPHWRSALPGSLDEFLARRKKKVRWQARKDAAGLRETYGEDVSVRVFRTADGLERLFEDSWTVHRTTYQSALGVGFSTDDLHRRLTELMMERGWFRGYVLYLREQPVAFCHGNVYRDRFGLDATGFDPAYADSRPGGFLLMRLIEDLCADESVTTFDFGFGDATYKRQLGDESWLEQDVAVWAQRPRPLRLSLTRTGLAGANTAARALLRRGGLVTSARRRWRTRAARRGS
jgi:CelD/BcsL family acetyltransferase involved in cellulose biosynthesis